MTTAPNPSEPTTPDVTARDVLHFWFGAPESPTEGKRRPEWFRKSDAFDHDIATRFGPLIERALRGELSTWTSTAHGALALILLVDQFPRNAYRDTPRAFAGDSQALAVASATVGTALDLQLPVVQRAFVYMPFEHAEGLAAQDEAVCLMARLVAADPDAQELLDYANRHRAVIARFGRFPHRNEILGRQSTAEEILFLREPGSRF